MHSAKLINGRHSRRIITAIAIGLLTTAVAAWCDCLEKYPDSDVNLELSKFSLQDCPLETMVQGYTKYLREQHQLIQSLQPAYSRNLEKMVHNGAISNDARQLRLIEYDNNLSELLNREKALAAWVSGYRQGHGTESGEEKRVRMNANLNTLLKNTKKTCQASSKKVKHTKEEITDSEINAFCKLDFIFRVSRRLNRMIEECLPTN